MLSGSPQHVVLGDDKAVTLTCVAEDDMYAVVSWVKDGIRIAIIKDDCVFIGMVDNTYNYTCDLANKIYKLTIPPDAVTDGVQKVAWVCFGFLENESNTWSLTLSGTYSI